MPVALRALAMREETLRYDQMEIRRASSDAKKAKKPPS